VGISIISRIALADELRARSLYAVTLQDVAFRRAFYIIRHKVRTLSPLGQTLEKFLSVLKPEVLFARDSVPHALP
jgi:hypothetical protein